MNTPKYNLSNALFPKARQAVLGLLYGQPDTSFYTNEIIRLSDIGTGVIQRELEKLASAGLISIQTIGNKKLYQANKANPLFEELQSIVMKTFGLTDVLQEALNPVAHHIKIAFIYGSIANQEDTAQSDIDLMLISDDLTYADIFPLLENPQTKLGRTINPTFYTTKKWVEQSKKNNHFVSELMKKPIIFLIGTMDELSKLK